MRAPWHALHADLVRASNRHSFLLRYRDLRKRHEALSPWHEPAALLDAMHRPVGDPEVRNRVLRALVADAQAGDHDVADVLLLLALWPGLDAVHRRLQASSRGELDLLSAEISGRVTIAVRSLDLDRVSRIAATLVRNVERDLRRWLVAEARRAQRHDPDLDPGQMMGRGSLLPWLPPGMDAYRARRLLTRLDDIVGVDAALVVDVAVAGVPQREASAAWGLGYEAGRKRYRRALAKLRAAA